MKPASFGTQPITFQWGPVLPTIPAERPATQRWDAMAPRRARSTASEGCLALMLDQIDYGVMLLDEAQHMLHVNRAAHAHLARHPGLQALGGVLVADDPRDQAALKAAIKAASTYGLRRMLTIGGETHGLVVAILPLPPADDEDAAAPAAPKRVLLMMSRHAICSELSAQGFARDHGLSSAEGHVLMGLCLGHPPAEIATLQGVALSTVRTQIANIRLKTHSASIRDLVQRVAQLPPMLSVI
ncbi:MAG TPA: helix-turn-helix transcriptional regulator [Variovorax sp.]|nr:helix-turn-helix transcriptional regulator [Variovorax sp.]